nr:hypothetical protein GCM10017745_88990 [Saccharothrix mutabilis subsp. capreolus]
MQDPVPGQGFRLAGGRTGRVPERRVGHEHTTADHADGEDPEQDRTPRPGALPLERSPDTEGESEEQQSTEDEVGDLHPAALAEREEAHGVPGQVEALSREGLRETRDQVERSGDRAAAEQELRGRRGSW